MTTLQPIEDRFRGLGPYNQDELIRDLKTLLDELNKRLLLSTPAADLAALAASIASTYCTIATAMTFETSAHASATYVSNSALAATLSSYVTAASLSLTLAGYVTGSYLTTNYTTTSALTTLLAAKQALSTLLTNLAAISFVSGDMIAFNGANTPYRLPKGTAGQFLRMDASAAQPNWDSLAFIEQANWQTAGWQSLSGVQGISNGGFRNARNMTIGGSPGGVGTGVVHTGIAGWYRFVMRFYISASQYGRIQLLKNGGAEIAFVQYSTQNQNDHTMALIEGIYQMAAGDYVYLNYNVTTCYHAQNHTALDAWWIAPPT